MKILRRGSKGNTKPTKEVTCKCCGSLIEYTEDDIVQEKTETVAVLIHYYDYIPCPACGKEITV